MQKIRLLSIIALLFISFDVCAYNDIPLKDEDDPIQSLGGKSSLVEPTALSDGAELTLSYPLATESQVILIDQSTQSTVYSKTFAASRSVIIDLAEEGLEEGTYELHVYAFGKWWRGEFEIEEY